MSYLRGLIMAFSMYSKVPMPSVKWEDKNMKYVFCFFPLIGVLIGAGLLLGFHIEQSLLQAVRAWSGGILPRSVNVGMLHLSFVLMGVALPIFLTGGIHLDGFLDTCDALHSYQEREKRLEILKDPHVGSFAVICMCTFLLMVIAGACLVVAPMQILLLSSGFISSRILSGFALVTFPAAKREGLLYTFSSASAPGVVRRALLLWYIGLMGLLFWRAGASAFLPHGIGLLFWGCYLRMARRSFGGLTGDLAGWFLTLYEGMFVWSAMLTGALL